jgi:Na+-translocating ferredoxin:NAD+ oxidoreductase subunit G
MSTQRTAATRLIGTLSAGGAIAGVFIVVAFQWAQPRILAHKAALLQAAVQEVLHEPARTQTLFVLDDQLVLQVPAGTDTTKLERIFAGYDAAGHTVGYAVVAAAAGFADVITLIYGYDPTTDRVLAMKVLDNKETPGLGDRIVKDSSFVNSFRGKSAPLHGAKKGSSKGSKNDVDLITGATISSRTVVAIINRSIERVSPLLKALDHE